MTNRALPQGREPMGNGTRFCNMHVYNTSHSPADMDSDNYFQPLWNSLVITDRILAISRQPDGSWMEAEFVVKHSERDTVIVRRRTEWVLEDVSISGPLTLMPQGNDKFNVIDATGRTVKRLCDGFTARALAKAYNGPALASPMTQFDPEVEALTSTVLARAVSKETDPDKMTRVDLQREMKALTGRGFHPQMPKEEMLAAYKAALAEKVAA